jgi:hypothetical protein
VRRRGRPVSSALAAGIAALALLAAAAPVRATAAPAAAPAPPARAATSAPAASHAPPKEAPVPPRAILEGAGPLDWNRRLESDRALAAIVPRWPVARVVDPGGSESLLVFPAQAKVPALLGAWPRGSREEHEVRIFPGSRWIVLLGAPDSAAVAADTIPDAGPPLRGARVHASNGTRVYRGTARGAPLPCGRDLVLWPDTTSAAFDSPTLHLRRLPSGETRDAWLASTGYAAEAPLQNFIAVNLAACVDPVTGISQDVLRLLDLEGKTLWTRPMRADHREFAVSNFGDVAIARDRWLRVLDRSGSERFRAALPLNTVGRVAMGSDGRFLLATTRAAGTGRAEGDLWVALYDTRRKAPVWERRDLSDTKGAEPLELSVSEDGERSLLRLSSGSVLLLGRDGAVVARFDLPRAPVGEYQPGIAPRRTWLSPSGALVGLMTPVARSRAEALGSLYEVPRRTR